MTVAMAFFRSLLYYISIALTAYAGHRFLEAVPSTDLLQAVLPLLFLFATIDLWAFITTGLIDGATSFSGRQHEVDR